MWEQFTRKKDSTRRNVVGRNTSTVRARRSFKRICELRTLTRGTRLKVRRQRQNWSGRGWSRRGTHMGARLHEGEVDHGPVRWLVDHERQTAAACQRPRLPRPSHLSWAGLQTAFVNARHIACEEATPRRQEGLGRLATSRACHGAHTCGCSDRERTDRKSTVNRQ